LTANKAGDVAGVFNRNTSNGPILEIEKDGSPVGSMGSYLGDRLFVGTGDTNLNFHATGDAVYPSGANGNTRNGFIDLGTNFSRFKDLYLSGGAYLGGTAAANKLDDYEEGTWTSTVGGNATYGVNTARYTKIGRQVFASFDLNITTIGTGSTVEISGLPFTCGDDIAEGVSISFYYGLATNVVELNAYVFGTTIRFRSLASAGSGLTDLAVLGDGCRVTGTAIYTTDS
jgi:hypothetical protein